MIGQTISHYKIASKLGAGGMGEVYLAEDTKLDRKVALKFLPSAMWNEAEAQQRLIREAKAASQLDHPNIVTIYGIEEFDGRPFIIMAHVRGVTLNEYCTSTHRSTGELIDLAIQMADGLKHAHDAGVIHRDLKPSNILVDDQGRVRILDFGIARLRGTARLTQTGSTVGTLAYSPPELAQGKEAEPTSDVYSLGVVIYQMLTGRLPFDADHEAALLYSILHEPPRPLSDFDSEIPGPLQKLVLRCLEKNPEKRFPNCAELAKELRRCKPGYVSGEQASIGAGKPSIAVLPFANMSADPENEYFSDGLAEELLNTLAKNSALKVTGRTSSFAFKGKHEDLRDIGQKLGVETLLEGSVRKAGNRVRITTQLVKASDGFHLWSETYDRVLDDIFAVQDDIAKSVATAMNVTLLGKPTPTARGNSASFNLVLQGNYFLSRNTAPSLEKAVALYREALAADPNDARAWAGLASAYSVQAGYGFGDYKEGVEKAKVAAERALALDENLPQAHEVMGWINLAFELRWDEAGKEFRHALSLAPGNSDFLTGLATYESVCDRLDEATRLVRQAVVVDPLNPIALMFRARIAMAARRFDEAEECYKKVLEISPGHTPAHASLSTAYGLQGRWAEAMAEAKQEQAKGYRCCALAIIHHALDEKRESDEALAALIKEGEQWAIQVAMVHARRNETDLAFEWLDRAFTLHDSGLYIVRNHPLFNGLHSDPRWPKYLEKIGLK
jgi:serine/threonine protein kinase